MPVSVSLATAVAVQLLCQLYKVVHHSIRDRRLQFRSFFSAGGMPSAHTAFVVALGVSIGLNSGFDSEVFAVALVFGAIVVYDILRLRAAVQRHSDILRELTADRGAAMRMPPDIGHTPAEVAVGTVVGAAFAFAAHLLIGEWS